MGVISSPGHGWKELGRQQSIEWKWQRHCQVGEQWRALAMGRKNMGWQGCTGHIGQQVLDGSCTLGATLELSHSRGDQEQQLHKCSWLLSGSCLVILGSPQRLIGTHAGRVPGQMDDMMLLGEFGGWGSDLACDSSAKFPLWPMPK